MKLYALIVALLMVPSLIAMAIGVEPGIAVSVSIVVTFVVSVYSLWDLYRLYLSTPRPRSQFFRMLLDANSLKLVIFGWFAYLIVAVILERYGVIVLPIPDPVTRSFVNGVVAVAFLAATVYYAVKSRRIIKSFIHDSHEVPQMSLDGSNGEPLAPDS